LNNKADPVSL
jgi:hypothetical protein